MTGQLTAYGWARVLSRNEELLAILPSGRVAIAPNFWHPSMIKWDNISQVRHEETEKDYWYGYVTIDVADLRQEFPDPLNKLVLPVPVKKRGPPTKYDECEFLRLCVLEACLNGLPPS